MENLLESLNSIRDNVTKVIKELEQIDASSIDKQKLQQFSKNITNSEVFVTIDQIHELTLPKNMYTRTRDKKNKKNSTDEDFSQNELDDIVVSISRDDNLDDDRNHDEIIDINCSWSEVPTEDEHVNKSDPPSKRKRGRPPKNKSPCTKIHTNEGNERRHIVTTNCSRSSAKKKSDNDTHLHSNLNRQNESASVKTNIYNESVLEKKKEDQSEKEKYDLRWNTLLKQGVKREDIKCEFCDKKDFKCATYLQRHEAGHKDNKPYSCDNCDKKFKYERCLLTHIQSIHSKENIYSCHICGHSFKNRNSLNAHVEVHSGKKHKCDQCDRAFTLKNQLKSHVRKFHQGIFPYVCKVCGKGYSKKIDFEPHVLKHTGEKPYECSQCSKAFCSNMRLKNHTKLHAEKFSFTCEICNAAFKRRDIYKAHMLRHKQGKTAACLVCGKKFYSKAHVKEHMITHTKDRRHMCSQCGHLFGTKSQLTAHLRSHTDERPFPCQLCELRFRSKDNREKHVLRKHTAEADRPWKCSHCNKGLATNLELVMHVRANHTGVRPYKCTECPVTFTAIKHLREHQRIHTGEKPYVCPVCNKAFAQSGSLSKHKATHHSADSKKIQQKKQVLQSITSTDTMSLPLPTESFNLDIIKTVENKHDLAEITKHYLLFVTPPSPQIDGVITQNLVTQTADVHKEYAELEAAIKPDEKQDNSPLLVNAIDLQSTPDPENDMDVLSRKEAEFSQPVLDLTKSEQMLIAVDTNVHHPSNDMCNNDNIDPGFSVNYY